MPPSKFTPSMIAAVTFTVIAILSLAVILAVTLTGPAATAKAILPEAIEPEYRTPFPIDAVGLWVDGSDPEWRSMVKRYHQEFVQQHPDMGATHTLEREPADVSSGTKDELYYSVLSIATFAPWVRTYFLVTQRPHKPWWWPTSGKVRDLNMRLVHHDEIFLKHADVLPVFNSNIIQAHIHNIPALAEHFILFDDDVFLGQPAEYTKFFSQEGQPVMRTEPCLHDTWPAGNWKKSLENMFTLAKESVLLHPDDPVRIPAHVASRMRKSALKHVVEDILPQAVAKLQRFRTNAEFCPTYMAVIYMHNRGMVIPLPTEHVTAFIMSSNHGRHLSGYPTTPDEFCLNDRMHPADANFLENLLPAS